MASSDFVLITIDDAFPNVYHIDRDADPVLIQISRDQYELRKGHSLLGVVAFYDGTDVWGWRFFPHVTGKRPSRCLHPNPEAALRSRRIFVKRVYTHTSLDEIA
jgi:hypothetical protein